MNEPIIHATLSLGTLYRCPDYHYDTGFQTDNTALSMAWTRHVHTMHPDKAGAP